MEIIFHDPNYLWLLLSLPLLIILHFFSLRFLRTKGWIFSNYEAIKRVSGDQISKKNSRLITKNIMLLILQVVIVGSIIFASSGPTFIYTGKSTDNSYVIAIDASSSMLADDFTPTRLDAAKDAAKSFLKDINVSSRVGIVSFSGTSFVESPMTGNIDDLNQIIDGIDIKNIGGTDIGGAIIASGNLLASEQRTKQIVLITDGRSTTGTDIADGIDFAKKNGIVIHTIGMATREGGSYIRSDIVSTVDEDSLKQIASETGGSYTYAKTKENIDMAFKSIIKVSEQKIAIDLQMPLMLVALGMIFVQWALINTRYRTLP